MHRDRTTDFSRWLRAIGLTCFSSLLAIAAGSDAIATRTIDVTTDSATADIAPARPSHLANINIIFPFPAPVVEPEREVVVEFVGLGTEWATIYLNGRRLANMGTHNRRQRFLLTEGAYRLEITGVTSFDTWATGYLDVGRSNSNVVVITFSPQGVVGVGGDPRAWIPGAQAR